MFLNMQVSMSPSEFEDFMRPISGDGGGQQFVRKMQTLARKTTFGGAVMVTGDDVEKWFRYRDDYGSGGFQSRLGRGATQESLL